MVEITSEQIRVRIDENGAQMISIYDLEHEIEYLWQRDSTYWSSSSPVVFPVIGKLNNLEFYHKGKSYPLKSNGLIRYERIPILNQEKHYVEFLFTNTEDLKRKYPFNCRVLLRYEIVGRELVMSSTIYNDGNEAMYYNYAGHPGFCVPMYENENCNDYYIEFEEKETTDIFKVCETGQLIPEKSQFFFEESRFFIRKNLFQKEALAFYHPKSNNVSIKNLNHNRRITVSFEDFDNLAIWSPYIKDKPLKFICIEPWVGHTDFKGYNNEISKKEEVACLEPNQHKKYSYKITFQ